MPKNKNKKDTAKKQPQHTTRNERSDDSISLAQQEILDESLIQEVEIRIPRFYYIIVAMIAFAAHVQASCNDYIDTALGNREPSVNNKDTTTSSSLTYQIMMYAGIILSTYFLQKISQKVTRKALEHSFAQKRAALQSTANKKEETYSTAGKKRIESYLDTLARANTELKETYVVGTVIQAAMTAQNHFAPEIIPFSLAMLTGFEQYLKGDFFKPESVRLAKILQNKIEQLEELAPSNIKISFVPRPREFVKLSRIIIRVSDTKSKTLIIDHGTLTNILKKILTDNGISVLDGDHQSITISAHNQLTPSLVKKMRQELETFIEKDYLPIQKIVEPVITAIRELAYATNATLQYSVDKHNNNLVLTMRLETPPDHLTDIKQAEQFIDNATMTIDKDNPNVIKMTANITPNTRVNLANLESLKNVIKQKSLISSSTHQPTEKSLTQDPNRLFNTTTTTTTNSEATTNTQRNASESQLDVPVAEKDSKSEKLNSRTLIHLQKMRERQEMRQKALAEDLEDKNKRKQKDEERKRNRAEKDMLELEEKALAKRRAEEEAERHSRIYHFNNLLLSQTLMNVPCNMIGIRACVMIENMRNLLADLMIEFIFERNYRDALLNTQDCFSLTALIQSNFGIICAEEQPIQLIYFGENSIYQQHFPNEQRSILEPRRRPPETLARKVISLIREGEKFTRLTPDQIGQDFETRDELKMLLIYIGALGREMRESYFNICKDIFGDTLRIKDYQHNKNVDRNRTATELLSHLFQLKPQEINAAVSRLQVYELIILCIECRNFTHKLYLQNSDFHDLFNAHIALAITQNLIEKMHILEANLLIFVGETASVLPQHQQEVAMQGTNNNNAVAQVPASLFHYNNVVPENSVPARQPVDTRQPLPQGAVNSRYS